MSISLVINSKNAAETIGAAMKSAQKLVDEVIVMDMQSSDDTLAVAKKHGAKVFSYPKDLGFADPARNAALAKASGDWILVLDADEEVLPGLAEVLQKIVSGQREVDPSIDAYFVPRQNEIFGRTLLHTGWWPDYQLRFFKKGSVQWTEKVHTAPVAKGKVGELPANPGAAILHHNYQTVSQFVERLNRYTDLEVERRTPKAVRHPETRPQAEYSGSMPAEIVSAFSREFFRRFFAEQGSKDGAHGLSMSLLQGMYELIVILKQWQKQEFAEPQTQQGTAKNSILALQKFQHDLAYWTADWHVRNSAGFSKIWWMIRRKMVV